MPGRIPVERIDPDVIMLQQTGLVIAIMVEAIPVVVPPVVVPPVVVPPVVVPPVVVPPAVVPPAVVVMVVRNCNRNLNLREEIRIDEPRFKPFYNIEENKFGLKFTTPF